MNTRTFLGFFLAALSVCSLSATSNMPLRIAGLACTGSGIALIGKTLHRTYAQCTLRRKNYSCSARIKQILKSLTKKDIARLVGGTALTIVGMYCMARSPKITNPARPHADHGKPSYDLDATADPKPPFNVDATVFGNNPPAQSPSSSSSSRIAAQRKKKVRFEDPTTRKLRILLAESDLILSRQFNNPPAQSPSSSSSSSTASHNLLSELQSGSKKLKKTTTETAQPLKKEKEIPFESPTARRMFNAVASKPKPYDSYSSDCQSTDDQWYDVEQNSSGNHSPEIGIVVQNPVMPQNNDIDLAPQGVSMTSSFMSAMQSVFAAHNPSDSDDEWSSDEENSSSSGSNDFYNLV